MRTWTRTLPVAVAALVATIALPAPAARAHDDDRVVVRVGGVGVTFGGHARECRWMPGRWVESVRRVVVRAGHWRTEVVPAAYEVRFDWNRWRFVRVCVKPESTRRVWVPAVIENRVQRTWEAGRWVCRDRCRG
jgi:hypothetical protein